MTKKIFSALVIASIICVIFSSCTAMRKYSQGLMKNTAGFETADLQSEIEIESESKIESKTASKNESKRESKTESKRESKTESKPESKIESKAASKTESKNEPVAPDSNSFLNGHIRPELNPVEPEKYYGYVNLLGSGTSAEIRAYRLLVEKISEYNKTIKFDFEISADEVRRAFLYYFGDYPQHFWNGCGGYDIVSSKKLVQQITLQESLCDLGAERLEQMKQEVNQRAKIILSDISTSDPEIERERKIHNAIILSTSYDREISRKNIHNMYGALVSTVAVCDGYSAAFQYLMREAGIMCLQVYGKLLPSDGKAASHAWNMVRLDNSYYHVDVTCDDPNIDDVDNEILKFTYFNVATKRLLLSHIISSPQDGGCVYPLPNATSEKYEFFNYYGLVSDTLSVEAFAKSCTFSVKNGYEYAHLRIPPGIMREAMNFFSHNQRAIIDMANGYFGRRALNFKKSITFTSDDEQGVCIVRLDYNK